MHQRIGIARALYKQAKLLVLDEATSALDNRTEAEVMAAVEALDKAITVILIAHRMNMVERCDKIIIERSRIIATRSYQMLTVSRTTFRTFVNLPKPLQV